MKNIPSKYAVLSDGFSALASAKPELREFRRILAKGFLMLVIFSMLLALLLPGDPTEVLRAMGWWINFVRSGIPYVDWAVRNSPTPVLVGAWFSMVWPSMFCFLLYLLCKIPYKVIGEIYCLHPVKLSARIKILVISLLFLLLAYNLFVERNYATSNYFVGHARIFEAQFINSRWGIFFMAPWIITLCFSIFFGATVGVIMVTLSFLTPRR